MLRDWLRARGYWPVAPPSASPPAPPAIDLEIERTQNALARHEARIDDMSHAWAMRRGSCCPGCMFGDEYTRAVAKYERTLAWLEILVAKRKRLGDSR